VLPSPSSSDAEQERRRVFLAESVIVRGSDLIKLGPNSWSFANPEVSTVDGRRIRPDWSMAR